MSANAYRAFLDAREPVTKLQLFSRWMALLNYEVSMCNEFDRVVTMTKQDADYLRSYAHRADIRDIPIGIDADYFQPRSAPSTDRVEVLFIGNFRHTPNIEAAAFLLENVAPHFPDLRFIIAGPYLPDAIRTNSSAAFLGYVPDTRQLFNSPSTIFAAPLFSGTGQRVKLLEAFAMACPVITTSLGAAGFPILTGEQAWIAETPLEFCRALRILAADKQERLRTGTQGRRMIVENFTWEGLSPQFWDLVHERP
jgi:glycosyltransferase involved in cell wall biosynthesis